MIISCAILVGAGILISALWNWVFVSPGNSENVSEVQEVLDPANPAYGLESNPVQPFDDEPEVGWSTHPLITEYLVEEKITAIEVDGGRSIVQLLRLRKDNKIKAKVSIIRLHDQSYWKHDRFDALEEGPRRPVDLRTWFSKSSLGERLRKAEFVLCIGLASNGASQEYNESLAYQRSERLCDWLRQSGVVAEARQKIKAVPLGMALSVTDGPESELSRRQRSAVIIGVWRENELIDLSTIYNEIASRVMLEGISLSDYSGVRRAALEL